MKKYLNYKSFYKHLILSSILLGILAGFISSCVDNPDTITTVTTEIMGDYLKNRPNEFSEFSRLLDTTEVLGLVDSYGKYTMFAPNNAAMRTFYASKGKSSLADFKLDTLKKIAYDHIIKGYNVKTESFIKGLMPYLTMSDRFIATDSRTVNNVFEYTVNKESVILTKDIEVSNGIIHVINHVLNPSNANISQAIKNNKRFSIFAQAMEATGLIDSLYAVSDNSYNPKNYSYIDVTFIQGGGSTDEIPVSRKYGYTVFMESDSIYALGKYNIHSLSDLIEYAKNNVYNEDPSDAAVNTLTDRRNSLNRFISYHMVNKKLTKNKLIDAYDTDHMIKAYDMFEYIETMCPNTLIEIKKERSTVQSNLLNKSTTTGEVIRIIAPDSDAVNGVYHELDNILVYSPTVAGEMSTKRIRMDAASFFPELTNNNMRYYDTSNPRSWVFPSGYIDRLKCSATTRFCYLNACDHYLDYEGDEIYLKGMYDFSLVTPPVPAGTYEVRLSYQPTGGRGAAQLYWDGEPCGIPLDLRVLANDPLIGWVLPGSDSGDPLGLENDKMMRNRGYLKGPNTYKAVSDRFYAKAIARMSQSSLRRILGTYTWTKASTHVFKVKAVREGQFMMDFIEFVPVELIESEGVD